MAEIAHTDVSAFMGIPVFDANSQPKADDVTEMIDNAESVVNSLEFSTSVDQKEILEKNLVASWVARAQGLFDTDGTSVGDGYRAEYNQLVKDFRIADKVKNINSGDKTYGKVRKVNR